MTELHGYSLRARGGDALQHAGHSSRHFRVTEPQDAKAEGGEREVAGGVVFDLCIVNAAIHLDDHAGHVAVEVRDEAVDHLLAAKVEAIELRRTEPLPEELLRWRHLAAEFLRALNLLRLNYLTGDEVRHGRAARRTYPPGPPP